MHIARQTPQELVVVDGSRWVSAICAAGALFATYRTISQHYPKGLILAAVFALFAMIFDLRKTFTFDSMQRIVRWKGRTILKAESGEIPFDKITNIDTETTTTSSRGGGTITLYRLAINASGTTIPMAYNYRGVRDGYSALRGQILEFVRPGSQSAAALMGAAAGESLESSLRTLLRQNRKMEAVELVRSTLNMNLTEAVKRIDAIECGMKQEE
jgi:hypothetical protein